jgi:microcystin degradation protein MlrC
MQPSRGLYERLAVLEGDWPMTFNMGFPAADFVDCGATVLAYGPDAEAQAEALLADILAAEPAFAGRVFTPEEGVAEALRLAQGARRPVILSDTQDNPGAGGDSDTMGMVRALAGVSGAAIGSIFDPAAAAAAHAAGVGATVRLALGGRSGIPGDAPLEAEYAVEALSDGRFVCPGAFHGGSLVEMGPSACLSLRGLKIVVTSAKAQMADRAMFRQVGIEPEAMRVLCVKSSVHFRADFAPIAEAILVCAAPGPMPVSPASLPWTRLRRGVRLAPLGRAFGG